MDERSKMKENWMKELANICFDIFEGKIRTSKSLSENCSNLLKKYPQLELTKDQNDSLTNFIDDFMGGLWEIISHLPKFKIDNENPYSYWENERSFSAEFKKYYLYAYLLSLCENDQNFLSIKHQIENMNFNKSVKELLKEADQLILKKPIHKD
jgi:hypothetical protein